MYTCTADYHSLFLLSAYYHGFIHFIFALYFLFHDAANDQAIGLRKKCFRITLRLLVKPGLYKLINNEHKRGFTGGNWINYILNIL